MPSRRLLGPLALAVSLVAPGAARTADHGADGRFETRRSSHFLLYQDVDIDRRSGWNGSVRFEREVLAALERAYDRLDAWLGLRPRRSITVIVYDPAAFDRQFGAALRFPAAGFYQGVIRIRGSAQLTSSLERVLHHELVHAALDEAAPSYPFPAWLNEGLAEWFEARVAGKRHLGAREVAALSNARRQGAWLPLETLVRPTFTHLAPRQVPLAYLQAYGFIDHLGSRYGERTLSELCEAVVRTRHVERALGRVYGRDLAQLETEYAEWIARAAGS
jgi:hypothetical protein